MTDERGLWCGKRTDTKEWITGYLRKIDPYMLFPHCDRDNETGIEVDGETLGRYTEHHNKNGNLVFAGDIIKSRSNQLFLVEFNITRLDFAIRPLTKKPYVRMLIGSLRNFEVAGNIHDNIELLKSATSEDIGNAAQDTLLPAT